MVGSCLRARTRASTVGTPVMSDASTQMQLVTKEMSVQAAACSKCPDCSSGALVSACTRCLRDWKDRPTRRGGGVALYVREQLECIELCLGADEERVESLWVRIKGQTRMGNTVVGVYYRPPDQEEEVHEAFYRQLKVASWSQALVLMADFNHPDISWEDNTARHMQSRRFLQNIDHNVLMQVVEEPMRRGVLSDLLPDEQRGTGGVCEGWG